MKLKALVEKRNDLVEKMQGIIDKAQEEIRAFSKEENESFESIKTEIRELDKTIDAIRNAEKEELRGTEEGEKNENNEKENRDFETFLRGKAVETRAEGSFSIGSNGNVIPQKLADRIIEKVKELSSIYSMATIYNVGGDLKFPVYDESADTGASFVEDMQELEATAGKFTVISLENNIVGVLKLISKSIINRVDFDIVSFVVNKVGENIAEFLEKKLLNGSEDKCEGVFGTENIITSASATAITADELIDLQMAIPEGLQQSTCWIMHKDTFRMIRKLKDNDGNYILNQDLRTSFGWTLLGKPVYISENAPKLEAGKTAIVYGDMSGLYVKLAQNVEMQILMEKYATQHAIGVVGYVEFDSKIVEKQKIAGLKIKAA